MSHLNFRDHTPEEAFAAAQLAGWAPKELDPQETAEIARNAPGVSLHVASQYGEATGKEVPRPATELFGHAFRDTMSAFEMVNFGGHDSDENARLQFVTHPKSIATLSTLANRSDEAKDVMIGDYRGGRSELVVAHDDTGAYLSLPHRYENESPRYFCPYAKDFRDNNEVHLLFKLFAPWAGKVAVHLTELHRK